MTGDDVRNARSRLGTMWDLDRPLKAAELGRVLGFVGRDPGSAILDYETSRRPVPGSVTLAVQLMLDGARPSDLEERLRR